MHWCHSRGVSQRIFSLQGGIFKKKFYRGYRKTDLLCRGYQLFNPLIKGKKKEEERESVFKVVHVLVSGYILFQEENNKIGVVMYFCLIIEKEKERDRER
jgi:hypothetical protein